jgi:cytochrome oxidase Cu insertion factor (SCO1/SenC/PrrC family)
MAPARFFAPFPEEHRMAITKGRTSAANHTSTLSIGAAAPDFELDSHLGSKWHLADQRGKYNVVAVFYPFAFTPV